MQQIAATVADKQLSDILEMYDRLISASANSDLSDLPQHDRQSLVTRAIAAIQRIAGSDSSYALELARILRQHPHLYTHIHLVVGVVQALREDVAEGYIQSVIELTQGAVFADFLEMASHLHDSGYKDAAAVICGSALEGHLHALCKRHGVDIESAGRTKKAELLNSELAKASAYSGLDQKNVTAWLGLRNKAAHGAYSEYAADQVGLLIASVRDFITRTPASLGCTIPGHAPPSARHVERPARTPVRCVPRDEAKGRRRDDGGLRSVVASVRLGAPAHG
jgi:hypothetical protein